MSAEEKALAGGMLLSPRSHAPAWEPWNSLLACFLHYLSYSDHPETLELLGERIVFGGIGLLSRSDDRAKEFLRLLAPLQGPLENYCRRMLRNRSLVEDVLQSAAAAAFAQFHRAEEIFHFKAWIFRFVTLEIFNRNRKHEPLSLGDVPTDLSAEESWTLISQEAVHSALFEDPKLVFDHFEDIVVDAMAKLAPAERAVILLRAIGEFSYREIHELLSIPLGSVIGYLSRARRRLRIILADFALERGYIRSASSSGGPST